MVRDAFLLADAMPCLRSTTSRLSDVALGLHQSLFAFHHSRAGAFAELFYECRGDFRHKFFVLYLNVNVLAENRSLTVAAPMSRA